MLREYKEVSMLPSKKKIRTKSLEKRSRIEENSFTVIVNVVFMYALIQLNHAKSNDKEDKITNK